MFTFSSPFPVQVSHKSVPEYLVEIRNILENRSLRKIERLIFYRPFTIPSHILSDVGRLTASCGKTRVLKSIFVILEWPNFFPWIVEWLVFSLKSWFHFVKREIPFLFSVNCERTNLSCVKRDLDLPPTPAPPPYHPQTLNSWRSGFPLPFLVCNTG